MPAVVALEGDRPAVGRPARVDGVGRAAEDNARARAVGLDDAQSRAVARRSRVPSGDQTGPALSADGRLSLAEELPLVRSRRVRDVQAAVAEVGDAPSVRRPGRRGPVDPCGQLAVVASLRRWSRPPDSTSSSVPAGPPPAAARLARPRREAPWPAASHAHLVDAAGLTLEGDVRASDDQYGFESFRSVRLGRGSPARAGRRATSTVDEPDDEERQLPFHA